MVAPPAVALRPMRSEDLPLLAAWLGQPHVRHWWVDEPQGLAAVTQVYGPCLDGRDPTELFVIEADGTPVGMIQRYRIADDPDWVRALQPVVPVEDAAGIDYLVGDPAATGRGIATAAIAAFVPDVFARYAVTSIVVSVQQANRRSWRVLERCGFFRVWSGRLDSPDPSDAGPAHVYVLTRS